MFGEKSKVAADFDLLVLMKYYTSRKFYLLEELRILIKLICKPVLKFFLNLYSILLLNVVGVRKNKCIKLYSSVRF